MKLHALLLLAVASAAWAQTNSSYVNFLRQRQQTSGVVWDMPVNPVGQGPSALTLEEKGALFQLWTIDRTINRDYLLDQKLVGAYLPTATVRIITQDLGGSIPRTRIDKGFSVEFNVAGLFTGPNIPTAAQRVMVNHHRKNYTPSKLLFENSEVLSSPTISSRFLEANGNTTVTFPVSTITHPGNPSKAMGEEHFAIHALADGNISQTQIAHARVRVWPLSTGSISGITSGQTVRFEVPQITYQMNDLYPRSDTFLMLYEGSGVSGPGQIVDSVPWISDVPKSEQRTVSEIDRFITKDGTYTIALMSQTVFDTLLLCDPITFKVDRTMNVNAMQVTYSDDNAP